MSAQEPTPVPEESSDAAQVAAYLSRHPDFFKAHLSLLESLRLPHESGTAVSLVARQIDVLREKNERLLEQLDDLVQIARENDALYQRIHQLTLTLLDAKSLEDVLASLDWGLHQYFQADFVVVRLLHPDVDSPVLQLFTAQDHPSRAWAEERAESAQPLCGKPDPAHAAYLFGESAGEVGSYAVIRLHHAALRGLFAIGSRDPERFRSDMGFVFLAQMSEILASRMASLLSQD
ncbi:MAG: hypothetical protein RLZZ627_879 [Pseudomonadota bacterium]